MTMTPEQAAYESKRTAFLRRWPRRLDPGPWEEQGPGDRAEWKAAIEAAMAVAAAPCSRCGHKAHPETPLECQWCPEGYCETPANDAELGTLLEGTYVCTRAWEAWQYGTMTEDDFLPAAETVLAAGLIAWRDAAVADAVARASAAIATERG